MPVYPGAFPHSAIPAVSQPSLLQRTESCAEELASAEVLTLAADPVVLLDRALQASPDLTPGWLACLNASLAVPRPYSASAGLPPAWAEEPAQCELPQAHLCRHGEGNRLRAKLPADPEPEARDSLSIEFQRLPLSLGECSVQTISVVADVIDNCNHACIYCHPLENGKWGGGLLSAGQVGDILRASEEAGILEVLLTGGEITMHPDLDAIMDQTRDLERIAVAMVTNATLISPGVVRCPFRGVRR